MNDPSPGNRPPRVLFFSYHSYVDPSSGAALSTRDVLEMLAGRGWSCGVLCGPHLDYEQPESLEQLLSDHGLPFAVRHGTAGSRPFALFHLVRAGIPVTVFDVLGSRTSEPPTRGRPGDAREQRMRVLAGRTTDAAVWILGREGEPPARKEVTGSAVTLLMPITARISAPS